MMTSIDIFFWGKIVFKLAPESNGVLHICFLQLHPAYPWKQNSKYLKKNIFFLIPFFALYFELRNFPDLQIFRNTLTCQISNKLTKHESNREEFLGCHQRRTWNTHVLKTHQQNVIRDPSFSSLKKKKKNSILYTVSRNIII